IISALKWCIKVVETVQIAVFRQNFSIENQGFTAYCLLTAKRFQFIFCDDEATLLKGILG
ncbi:MAG: hypothetical protein AB8G86_21375, partial [Saprospiraceae bacterium]